MSAVWNLLYWFNKIYGLFQFDSTLLSRVFFPFATDDHVLCIAMKDSTWSMKSSVGILDQYYQAIWIVSKYINEVHVFTLFIDSIVPCVIHHFLHNWNDYCIHRINEIFLKSAHLIFHMKFYSVFMGINFQSSQSLRTFSKGAEKVYPFLVN